MLTIAVVFFGITVVNWHLDLLAELAKYIPIQVVTVINNGLKDFLHVPIEFQPALAGAVRLDIKFGADASIVASGSRAVTSAPTGTITTTPAHPDVVAVATSPAPGDLDNFAEPTTSTAPADAPTLSDGPLSMLSDDAPAETPLQRALETNKAK